MALDFPPNPIDGQLYPDPPEVGVQQYVWSSDKGTWLTVFKGLTDLTAELPLFLSGPETSPTINIRPATPTQSGYLSADDQRKIDTIPDVVGTVTSVQAGTGLGAPTTGDEITSEGTINLLPANPTTIGGVKPGEGLSVDGTGIMGLRPPSSLQIGGVKAGNGVTIAADGTISLKPGGSFVVLDNIGTRFDSRTTSFSMTVSSVPFAPPTINALLIFVGGVLQLPNISFSIAGPVITFSGAPPAGASFYGISLT